MRITMEHTAANLVLKEQAVINSQIKKLAMVVCLHKPVEAANIMHVLDVQIFVLTKVCANLSHKYC